MATLYADVMKSVAANAVDRGPVGIYHREHFKWIAEATFVATDTLQIFKLPPNVILYGDSLIYLESLATGSTPTYDVGYLAYTAKGGAAVAADDDGLVVADAAVIGSQYFSALGGALWQGVGDRYVDMNNESEITLTLVLNTGFTFVTGDEVSGYISYTQVV